jgi:hypothetical protein
MKNPRLRFGAAITVLILAGLSAFLIGRYAASDDAPAEAQVVPEETPSPGETPQALASPDPDVVAMETAIAEDNEKPLFTGTLNGITFIGEGTPFPRPADDHICDNSDLRQVEGDDARDSTRDSALDFEATGLSSGLELVREIATLCGNDVINMARIYSDNADGNTQRVSIGRSNSAPAYPALAPRDRLEATTIGDREAVVVKSISGVNRTRIIMRDEKTIWTIIVDNIDEDDAIRMAEGVK